MKSSAVAAKTVDQIINDIGFGWFQAAVILLCSFVQAADVMEIHYVSMVSQRLQCIWRISDIWKSLISSATFLGLFVGACIWGTLGDKYCRRSVTSICMCFIVFYGCLTAAAPTVLWVAILRLLVGVGVGGVLPIVSTVLSEFMPTDARGFAWFLYHSFWFVGGLLEVGLAWLMLDWRDGWRYLALITAIPMAAALLPWSFWLPPSPRQSLLQGKLAETRMTLDRMAEANGRPKIARDFDLSNLQGSRRHLQQGSIAELCRPGTYLRQTLQLAFIFFTSGFCFYGMILLNVQIPLLLKSRCFDTNVSSIATTVDWPSGLGRTCHSCEVFNYVELFVPAAADLASALLNAFIVERLIGRRATMALSFGLSACVIPGLSFCMPSPVRIVLFFASRLFITSGQTALILYIVESYPTTLRSTAVGFCACFGRLASVLSPFVAQVFVSQVSLLGGLLIFACLLALAAIDAAMLPWETKHQPLAQTEFPGSEGDEKDQEASTLNGADDPAAHGKKLHRMSGGMYGSVSTKND